MPPAALAAVDAGRKSGKKKTLNLAPSADPIGILDFFRGWA
jgi:hypothetical protein